MILSKLLLPKMLLIAEDDVGFFFMRSGSEAIDRRQIIQSTKDKAE